MALADRKIMPQIREKDFDEFREFCNGYGVHSSIITVKNEKLAPVQKHVNKKKVEFLAKNPHKANSPIMISKNGDIMDGHHRWLANSATKRPTTAVKFNCDLEELFKLGHMFPKSFTKSINEIYPNKTTTYRK